MKRDYINGTKDDVVFFVGNEVEQTPAFTKVTLFVVGLHEPVVIQEKIDAHNSSLTNNFYKITHIYFGANQSYKPTSGEEFIAWDNMIKHFLDAGYQVTLDFDVRYAEEFLDSGLTENHNFIPIISVKLPYINQFGYNAVVKLDDKDFAATNPGVWCHYLHELQDRRKLTTWECYTEDKPL